MAKPLLESTVLTSRDPALDSRTDEWPEFDLTGVHVYLPDSDTTSSLLLASEHFPLRVIGQLEPPNPKHQSLLLPLPTKKRPTIEIPEVRTYSYGQYADGSIAIWAAGKAGWYTIRPGRSYKAIYDDMVDAVKAFYFIADAYREPRHSGRGKNATILPEFTAKELFAKFGTEFMGLDADPAGGAAEKLYEHKDFLLSNMIAGREIASWNKNPLYLHLRKKFPELHSNIKRRVAARNRILVEEPSEKEEQSKPTKPTPSTNSAGRRRGRPPKMSDQAPDAISISSGTTESRAGKMTSTNKHAARLEKKSTRPAQPPPKSSRQLSVPTLPVDGSSHGTEPEASATPVESVDSDEGQHYRRKRKSGLRPKSSQASKGLARESKYDVAKDDGDDDDDGGVTTPGSSVRGKRKNEPLESGRPVKVRTSERNTDEGIDMLSSASEYEDAESSSEWNAVGHHDLPLRTLNHEPDPVQEDTWVCALDGCVHKVYAASKPDSQRLIREHYALHAYDDDERVQMVKRLQAPSLPVRHLMEKVRQQAKVEGFPASSVAGTRFPDKPTKLPSAGVVQRY